MSKFRETYHVTYTKELNVFKLLVFESSYVDKCKENNCWTVY